MRLNTRGEGFSESMIAMIAVVVSLTVFMAILPSAFIDPAEEDVPTYILKKIRISNGELIFDDELEKVTEDNDLSGMVLMVNVFGSDLQFRAEAGDITKNNIKTDSGTFMIEVDGRMKNASYEIGVWR